MSLLYSTVTIFDVVVTRHQGLVDYLKEEGCITDSTPVMPHASKEDLKGKNVIFSGVLPHSVSVHCLTVTEIPLKIPEELRGEELSSEDVRRWRGESTTYSVESV